MTTLSFFFIGAALLSFALTPLAVWVARRADALDKPDARKVHQAPVPRLGGLAIFGSVVVCLGLALGFHPGIWEQGPWPSVLIGGLVVYLLGFTDDINTLGPKVKLAVQALAALVAVESGITIDTLRFPGGAELHLGLWALPISAVWIVGVTNAFNLIDGLDGLAGGLALIATFTLFMLVAPDNRAAGLLCVVLAGALVGFLRYNFHPARIFMGDSGSLFVGYLIGCLTIEAARAEHTLGFVAPMLTVAVPLLDTATAMLRRYGASVWQGNFRLRTFAAIGVMFQPDRGHIHHRLLDAGLTQRQAVGVLYFLGAAMGGLGVWVQARDPSDIIGALVASATMFYLVRAISRRRHIANP